MSTWHRSPTVHDGSMPTEVAAKAMLCFSDVAVMPTAMLQRCCSEACKTAACLQQFSLQGSHAVAAGQLPRH
jgi:hypothetical protein